MEPKAVLAWINRRLKELGKSAHKASKDAGHPDVIRNLQRHVAGDGPRPKEQSIRALEKVLGPAPVGLFDGRSDDVHNYGGTDLEFLIRERDFHRRRAEALDIAIEALQSVRKRA